MTCVVVRMHLRLIAVTALLGAGELTALARGTQNPLSTLIDITGSPRLQHRVADRAAVDPRRDGSGVGCVPLVEIARPGGGGRLREQQAEWR